MESHPTRNRWNTLPQNKDFHPGLTAVQLGMQGETTPFVAHPIFPCLPMAKERNSLLSLPMLFPSAKEKMPPPLFLRKSQSARKQNQPVRSWLANVRNTCWEFPGSLCMHLLPFSMACPIILYAVTQYLFALIAGHGNPHCMTVFASVTAKEEKKICGGIVSCGTSQKKTLARTKMHLLSRSESNVLLFLVNS